MTVVVGIRGRKGVLLAGDSQASLPRSGSKGERQNGKAHLLSETVGIAICGSPRISQVLQFMQCPKIPLGEDPYRFAVMTFIPKVRTTLREAGCLTTDNGLESFESSFILAVRDRVFEVHGDLQVGEESYPWVALGSGGEAAAGHLHGVVGETAEAVDDEKLLAIARAAVTTSIGLNAFCGGKISHVRTKRWSSAERKVAEEILAE